MVLDETDSFDDFNLDEEFEKTAISSKNKYSDFQKKETPGQSYEDYNDEVDDDIDLDGEDSDNDFGAEDLSSDMGSGGDGVVPLEKHGDLLKELTSFDPYIKTVVNNWLGVTWSETESKFIPNPFVSPIMNIKGVSWCIGRLTTYVRKNNIMTNIVKADYNYIMLTLTKELLLNLLTRKEEFGLKNLGDIDRVINEIEHSTALILMGAGDGKYNEFLSSTTQHNVTESIAPNREQTKKKSGTFGRLKDAFVG